ncbi:MAG TPA: MFS transporter [Candidatus Limnocylindria bacterium]|nr:MFS transporter [Candidatus Limnocylindria bacterium]
MNSPASNLGTTWWKLLNRYQWFVLVVASLGWLLDCMDQQLFNLARVPAMKTLLAASLGHPPTPADVGEFGGYATSIFLLGWASGGLVFGVLGDRWGRAKTMLLTILLYSGCTGLSAFAGHFWDFALFRFLTGLGVGGEFAVGVALVAEVMPGPARPYALSLLQALSTVGNVTAACTSIALGRLEENGVIGGLAGWPAWRWMFLLGALPAILVVFVRRGLKEPEAWLATVKNPLTRKGLGDYGELFGNPRWATPAALAALVLSAGILIAFLVPLSKIQTFFGAPATSTLLKHAVVAGFAGVALVIAGWGIFGGGGDTRYRGRAVVGLALALAGVIGVWGIGFFSFDLVRSVLTEKFKADGMPAAQIAGAVTFWAGITSVVQNVGSFFGVYSFGLLAQRFGRRPAFAVSFTAAMFSTAVVFLFLKTSQHIFLLVPVMGFCQLSVFGGYAIYFPELFPTRLRSTGTSFCYNVGRFVAAAGPAALGVLTGVVFKDQAQPLRYAGVTMCAVYLVGLIALPFAPETKDQPLPEEERGFNH